MEEGGRRCGERFVGEEEGEANIRNGNVGLAGKYSVLQGMVEIGG